MITTLSTVVPYAKTRQSKFSGSLALSSQPFSSNDKVHFGLKKPTKEQAEVRELTERMLLGNSAQGIVVTEGGAQVYAGTELEGTLAQKLLPKIDPKKPVANQIAKAGGLLGVLTSDGIILDDSAKSLGLSPEILNLAVGKDILERIPKDQKIPFYLTLDPTEIKASLERIFKTDVIRDFLPLLTGQEEIPAGADYENLRTLKKVLTEQVDFFKFHCPTLDTQAEDDLNARLTKLRPQLLAVALYTAYYNNVDGVNDLLIGPLSAALVGTGIGIGVDTLQFPETWEKIATVGTIFTVGDFFDNFLGLVPQLLEERARGKEGVSLQTDDAEILQALELEMGARGGADVDDRTSLKQLVKNTTKDAGLGALAGSPGNYGGGSIYAFHGWWHIIGKAVISIMTSMGFASYAHSAQNDSRDAYIEILQRNLASPSPRMLALRQKRAEIIQSTSYPEDEKTSLLEKVDRQLETATKRQAKKLGRRDVAASKTTARANLALFLSGWVGFVPDGIYEFVAAGSENFIQALKSGWDLLWKLVGFGPEAKAQKQIAKKGNVDFNSLEIGAIFLQRVAYGLGYVPVWIENTGKGIKWVGEKAHIINPSKAIEPSEELKAIEGPKPE